MSSQFSLLAARRFGQHFNTAFATAIKTAR